MFAPPPPVDEGDVALGLVLQQLRRGWLHLLLLHLPQRGNSQPNPCLGAICLREQRRHRFVSRKTIANKLHSKTPSFLDKILHKTRGREKKITVTQTIRATEEQQQVQQVEVEMGWWRDKAKKTV